MAHPDDHAKRHRRPWLIFGIGFAVSLLGAVVLFNPTLEFAVVDVLEKLHLPIGLIGNVAMLGDYALFAVSGLGLVLLAIFKLFRARRQP